MPGPAPSPVSARPNLLLDAHPKGTDDPANAGGEDRVGGGGGYGQKGYAAQATLPWGLIHINGRISGLGLQLGVKGWVHQAAWPDWGPGLGWSLQQKGNETSYGATSNKQQATSRRAKLQFHNCEAQTGPKFVCGRYPSVVPSNRQTWGPEPLYIVQNLHGALFYSWFWQRPHNLCRGSF